MVSDFQAGLEFFICCPVSKKVQAVINAGTNQGGSKNKSNYMHLVEDCQSCKHCNSQRNQNRTYRIYKRPHRTENKNQKNYYSQH